MSEQSQAEPISKKKVVYRIPGMEAVRIERNREYARADSGPLMMDLYYPAADAALRPAVIIVLGYRDAGYQKAVGCSFKDAAFTQDWARLIAASGIVAITYTNDDPAADLATLLRHVREHAPALGIDRERLGVFGTSGSGPVTLSALMTPDCRIRCAVFGWAMLMDIDGATHVAESARQWRFADACAGRSFDAIARNVPIFIARAGQDQFQGLNDALDRFVAKALAANLPVAVVNHPSGPHAFDVFDDTDASREIIREMLAFMRFHLAA